MHTQKPAQYIRDRGVNVGGTGLFQDGDGLVMYPTRKIAGDFAQKWGWPKKYVCRVYTALFGGYAVAQFGQYTLTFLKEDGSTLEHPYVDEKRLPLKIE